MSKKTNLPRRQFITQSAAVGAVTLATPRLVSAAPAILTSNSARPVITHGVQLGDPRSHAALIWSRCDRPSRMIIEHSYTPNFSRVRRIRGPLALAETDFTARVDLRRLYTGAQNFVRVRFQSLDNPRALSEPQLAEFRTPGARGEDIRFCWGGDTAGQGWGINTDFGGMKIYETMRQTDPDFFIHSGDTVYADGPIAESVTAEDDREWRNVVTPEVMKVAETMKEFRGRYQYNMMDEHVRRFNAQVPQIWQWDDHEVVNNWSDSKDLTNDDRYTVKDVPLLIERGAQAFLEYAPIRPPSRREPGRVYRSMRHGELLEIFVIDMRSYRGPNTGNMQEEHGPETQFLGNEQLAWLKRSLLRSTATWKVIASDMPVGLVVRDGPTRFENMANGDDGSPRGRELEMANLLRFIKRRNIKNIVWLTADVHYCAAHHYAPERAAFKDFSPFWEFVSGPLNAGSFGPNDLDGTFGPRVDFQLAPEAPNLSPYAGLQFFGQVDIDACTHNMTVFLKDLNGDCVYEKTLEPEGHRFGRGPRRRWPRHPGLRRRPWDWGPWRR